MQANEIQARLAENIKKIRKEKGMTQLELAEQAGISEGMIKSIETCHAWPSENTLQQISCALQADVHRFFMPTATTLAMQSDIQAELRQVIKERYADYLNEVIRTLG